MFMTFFLPLGEPINCNDSLGKPSLFSFTTVYLVLDSLIRENMLRRLFSFRKPKQEEKDNFDIIQKENVDPNSQVLFQCIFIYFPARVLAS